MKVLKLHTTNFSMPIVGLGTWQANSEETKRAVTSALDAGYRHIDTAFNYNNEDVIGDTLKAWLDKNSAKREELFITTKLPHIANRANDVEKFLKLSLQKLKLDYVDLYLIHVPFGFYYDEETLTPKKNENGEILLDLETDHISLWKAMESVMNKGLAKNIGLSNFNEAQIKKINQNCQMKPQVLQIECHAYLQQESIRELCAKENIAVVAYSPLGSPGARNHFMNKYNYELKNFPDILGHPIVTDIAARHNKSPGQIVLRFLVQNNVAVIPKSANLARIVQNIDLFEFELTVEEVNALKQLDQGSDGRIIDFYFWKGVEKHPCYPF
ncbi:aldo-keto reductase family 1 member B7-like [Arctopsyche grandis]|uniref:aldo-keto reductase family 1 member B7-like n=1 Tax=Arctopsyche grandis TaxID=121162 RepID=UPI00406D777B